MRAVARFVLTLDVRQLEHNAKLVSDLLGLREYVAHLALAVPQAVGAQRVVKDGEIDHLDLLNADFSGQAHQIRQLVQIGRHRAKHKIDIRESKAVCLFRLFNRLEIPGDLHKIRAAPDAVVRLGARTVHADGEHVHLVVKNCVVQLIEQHAVRAEVFARAVAVDDLQHLLKGRMHRRLTPSHQRDLLDGVKHGLKPAKPLHIEHRRLKVRRIAAAHDAVEIAGVRQFKHEPPRQGTQFGRARLNFPQIQIGVGLLLFSQRLSGKQHLRFGTYNHNDLLLLSFIPHRVYLLTHFESPAARERPYQSFQGAVPFCQ